MVYKLFTFVNDLLGIRLTIQRSSCNKPRNLVLSYHYIQEATISIWDIFLWVISIWDNKTLMLYVLTYNAPSSIKVGNCIWLKIIRTRLFWIEWLIVLYITCKLSSLHNNIEVKETASSTNQSTITESSQSTSKRTVIDQNSKTDVINRMWLKMKKVRGKQYIKQWLIT